MRLFLRVLIVYLTIGRRALRVFAWGVYDPSSFHDDMNELNHVSEYNFDVKSTVIPWLMHAALPPRVKMFQEHIEDFLQIIKDESSEDISLLLGAYLDFYPFLNTWEYLKARNLREVFVNLMQLDEFQELLDFLENEDIDIFSYVDRFEDAVQNFEGDDNIAFKTKGNTFKYFILDVVFVLPTRKLKKLFAKKMAQYEDFRTVFTHIFSDEFDELVSKLKNNIVFRSEMFKLSQNGIDIKYVLVLVRAVFGLP